MAFQHVNGCSIERLENQSGEDGRKLGLSGLLYACDLALCGESQEDLRSGNEGRMFC